MTGAAPPPACWNSIFTGPTPATHQIVRVPLPYGSPSAPAWVITVLTRAAVTGFGNAGTETCSCPMYVEVLETSCACPPVLVQVKPLSRGSSSTGWREPQITL